MNKTAKGGLAAGAAAVLLLGGAGTLAFWTDDATLNGGAISSGDLTLTDGECDEGWTYATGAAGDGAAVELFVPGDDITTTCTFAIEASGDNLSATLNIDPVTFDEAGADNTSLTLVPTATYALSGGGALDEGDNVITDDEDGETVTATINVSIPFGTSDRDAEGPVNENDTQLTEADLDDIAVSLTQIDPNP